MDGLLCACFPFNSECAQDERNRQNYDLSRNETLVLYRAIKNEYTKENKPKTKCGMKADHTQKELCILLKINKQTNNKNKQPPPPPPFPSEMKRTLLLL